MNKSYLLLIGMIILSFQFTLAQSPQKMSYQMVARDAGNQLIINSSVGIKITILKNSPAGISVYEETHSTTTNVNGLATISIGTGTPILNTFSSIDWASAEHYIKTEVDPLGGTNYSITATNQLLSVPYALHANSANANKVQDSDANTKVETEKNLNENKIRFTLNGTEHFVMNRGTLEVLNAGNSVMIGKDAGLNENYESGNHNVGIGNQALKASFNSFNNVAVGDRALWSQVDGNDNVAVGTDALRSNNSVSNVAVGSLAGAENNGVGNVFLGNGAGQNELGNNKLYIANSNTTTPLIKGDFETKKVTINDALEAKSIQLTNGAVNGYVLQSDANGNAVWVNPNTLTISPNSRLQDADANTKIEVEQSPNNDKIIFTQNGTEYHKMNKATLEFNNSRDNLYIGNASGQSDPLTISTNNIGIGSNSLQNNSNGNSQIAIGKNTLKIIASGENNIAIGSDVLSNKTAGNYNTAIGTSAGLNNSIGHTNTLIGAFSGQNNNGSGNVFIGFGSGWDVLGDNKLIIQNSTTSIPLISGNFATKIVQINDKLSTKSFAMQNGANNGYILQSDASGNATWVNPSTLPESDPKVATTITNSLSKWNGSSLVNSQITDNGTGVGIGTTNPTAKLDVNGSIKGTLISANALQLIDGATTGYILQSGTIGDAHWVDPLTLNTATKPLIADTDANTKVEVEKTPNEDKIVFTQNGTEYHRMNKATLEFNNSRSNIYLGNASGLNDPLTSSTNNIGIGLNSLQNNTAGSAQIAIGRNTLKTFANGQNNIALGTDALMNKSNGHFNIAIGTSAGLNNINGNSNILIGSSSGQNNNGSRNIFIGNGSGWDATGDDKLIIQNTSSSDPLITGNFVAKSVQINDNLSVKNLAITNGAASGYILQSDATGNSVWTNPQSLNTATKTLIADTDANTKVEVEKTPNEDKIVFTQNGTEYHRLNKATLEFNNSRSNIFIGNASGLSEPLTTSSDNIGLGANTLQNITASIGNVAIGKRALQTTTDGGYNVAIGHETMKNKQNGGENVAIGLQTGLNNLTGTRNTFLGAYAGANNNGSNNVFIGYGAGYDETGNNKLIVKNSALATETPLIEGDFSTKNVKINDNLTVKNLAISNGAVNGYVLQSDATGNTTWTNPTSLSVTEIDPQVAATTTNIIPKWNGTSLVDGQIYDNGTNIGIGTNSPIGRLHVVGKTVVDNGSIAFTNTGRSIFIGDNAGINDDKTLNKNTFVGHSAGEQNITGSTNVYIGNQAGQLNNGFGNVFIGNQAGALDTNTDNKFYLSNEFGNDLMSGDFISKMVTMNGSLGIGTNSTANAKLVVNGNTTNSLGSFGYLKNNGTTGTNTTGDPYAYSIYASHRIAASEFNAFSDARIKNIKGISDKKQDLETLSKIEITNYSLKDSIGKGSNNYKKVIAQQVEKVYPQAVSKLTDVIPDIYKQAEIKNGFIALENDLKVGEKVKIITQKGEEIVEIKEANSKAIKIENLQNGFVFVYGRQVSDFRSVDYEALSTLNISATQELLKRIEVLEGENAQLKVEVTKNDEINKSQSESIQLLMNELNKLKNKLEPIQLTKN